MSLNFPVDPSDGDLYEGYIFDDTAGVWNSNPAQIASRFVTSASAPENPSEGDGWFDSTTAKSYTYYDGVWVQIGAPGAIRFNQLEGIEVTDPLDGEIIVYDSASSQWVNESPITTFGGLEDTNIATPATGDSLVYDGSDWTNQPLTTRRNLLYNGAMQVHQRGTSVTGITTAGYYTADRFAFTVFTQGTWTQSIENDAPTGSGFRKSFKVLCTTADAAPSGTDVVLVQHKTEGQNLQSIRKGTSEAKELTLSFWVKSNVTGTYTARLSDNDNARHVAATYSVVSSGVWEKKVITFPADTTGALDNDNNSSLDLNFGLGAGPDRTSGTLPVVWESTVVANQLVGQTNLAAATNNYWQITGVQLEVGPVATPFEFKSFGEELLECQRYYYAVAPVAIGHPFGNGSYYGAGDFYSVVPHPVFMRASPTYTSTAGGWRVFSAGAFRNVNVTGFFHSRNSASTLNFQTTGGANGDPGWVESSATPALANFDAEL